MAKKETNTVAGIDASAWGLSVEQLQLFNGLSVEDKTEIAELGEVALIVAAINTVASIQASNAQKVEVKTTKSLVENLTILSAGGFGLRAGSEVSGFLLGTYHIFSKDFKENWSEFMDGDDLYYYNSLYKLRGVDGNLFGIWSYGTLSDLRKIPTFSSKTAAADPFVKIKYQGKIEGRDVLKAQYGIELTKGNAAHVFETFTNVDFNRYESGIVNSINAPFPMGSKKSALTSQEATRLHYERIMANQGQGTVVSGLLAQ